MNKKNAAKQLALGMAVSCVRRTFLEDLHAGMAPSSETQDYSDVKVVSPYGEIPWNNLSRISDTEMRKLMKEVVNNLYSVLLHLDDREVIEGLILAAKLAHWDEPKDIGIFKRPRRKT